MVGEEVRMEAEEGESRRTRSQLAPDWTVHESLILVNELCAVEGDCLNTLSSFQKWKIVVDNCNSLDVNRGLNQCRRQWDSLISDYSKIKQWNHTEKKKTMNASFWNLEVDVRRKVGLPEDFDSDLFKAIEDHNRAREGRCDSDPENDGDAEPDLLINVIDSELGSNKRIKKGVIVPKQSYKEREKPVKIQEKIKAEQSVSTSEGNPYFHRHHLKQTVVAANEETPTTVITKNNGKMLNEEEILSQKVRDNADMINITIKGEDNDYKLSEVNIVRRQADDLVHYMTNIEETLNQLYKLVQD